MSERSGIPAAHPDWLVRDLEDDAPTVLETREDWGGRMYALDGAHPAARQWLFDLARRVVHEWGYDYLRLDQLQWASAGGSHFGGLTPAEACRLGLGALRDGAGSDAFLLGCDAPLQASIGFVNGMRIAPDATADGAGIQVRAHAAALRSFYHRGVWLNEPDALASAHRSRWQRRSSGRRSSPSPATSRSSRKTSPSSTPTVSQCSTAPSR